ncbi:MAG: SDR family oxidoreductase [Candidatus Binataceae bacterium]|jgi:NAD(P)-dependent dehydrogenase (short-subunit alcohol dehydrogenase family)
MADKAARKVALVTGAGRSAGRAIALKLAGEGFVLALTARTFEELEETRRLSGFQARDALILLADLTLGEAPLDVFGAAMSHFGRLDVLINAAHAVSPSPSLLELEEADQDRVIAVNLRAPIALARLTAQRMRQQSGGGTIINFIRRGGRFAPDPITAAADMGIAAFADAATIALRPFKIKAATMVIPPSGFGIAEAAAAMAIIGAEAGDYPLASKSWGRQAEPAKL